MRVSLHQCALRRTMDYFQILVLVLQITQVFTKSRSKSKKYQQSSSDEDSIENLLYYKDCQRKGKEEATFPPVPLRYEEPPPPPPPRQPECPFPKMCCALTCGNECGGSPPQPSYVQRQMEHVQNNIQSKQPIQPIPQPRQPEMGPIQPQIVRRKKKVKFQPNKLPTPIATRRDFSGFTKEKIKGLIAQDDDIRKILKDLVRVTMQKVDLLDMVQTNRDTNNDYDENLASSPPPDEFDDYVE